MDPGTAIAGIEICWKVGKVLVESCQTWRAAQEEVSDRITIVEHAWHRTRMQLEFIERMTLEEEYRRVLDDLLRILALRLSAAIAAINQALKADSKKRPGFLGFAQDVKKPKYVRVKSAIDEAIQDVEAWQRRFDPSWFLIIRAASPAIDQELRGARARESATTASVTLQGDTWYARPTQTPFRVAESMREVLRDSGVPRVSIYLPNIALDTQAIPYSSASIASPGGAPASRDRSFIVDSITCRAGTDLDALTKDTRVLASRLTAANHLAFGLLNCKGVMKVPADPASGRLPSFTMIFRMPEGFEGARSLRQFLMTLRGSGSGATASLSRRVCIAGELARSVSSVHTFKFVHKNVRPESVLLLEEDGSRSDGGGSGVTYLVGFDGFRAADGATSLRGDIAWDRNLYRHPTRQGEFPSERYRIHHDVYSLGVCLLELGLGESLVEYDALGVPQPAPKLADAFLTWLEATGRGSSWDRSVYLHEPWGASLHLKDYFEHLATTEVPRCAGSKFAQIVMACLTCLDDEGEVLEQGDPYGIDVGMGFIQDVLLRLGEIVV